MRNDADFTSLGNPGAPTMPCIGARGHGGTEEGCHASIPVGLGTPRRSGGWIGGNVNAVPRQQPTPAEQAEVDDADLIRRLRYSI
jgi:hypothetical protein